MCRYVPNALRGIAFVLSALAIAAPSPARAQDEAEPAAAEEDAEAGETAAEAPAAEADTAKPEEPVPPPDTAAQAEDDDSTVEHPGKTYYFVGARYRGIIVPKFMIALFGDGGRTVYVNGGGPEFGIRKDGFEYDLSLWYASYKMDDTPFKAKDDPAEAWELVKSEIKVVYLTADFLWSKEFVPEFAMNFGLGAGFGLVFGDLERVQAYPVGDGYARCTAPGNPHGWCGNDNEHYGDYTEPSWAGGGSKPNLFPWLAIQTGFRFKPHRNFVARLDGGFGTSGFFWGLGLDYGL